MVKNKGNKALLFQITNSGKCIRKFRNPHVIYSHVSERDRQHQEVPSYNSISCRICSSISRQDAARMMLLRLMDAGGGRIKNCVIRSDLCFAAIGDGVDDVLMSLTTRHHHHRQSVLLKIRWQPAAENI